jgi:hypothetical protein
MVDFSEALIQLKQGSRLYRSGWNGKNMYVELQVPDNNSKMTLPYLYMRTVDSNFVPWLASQTDILADDWVIF